MSKPFVVISSDTHVGASSYDAFTEYFDAEFRDEWATFASATGDGPLPTMARMAGERPEDAPSGTSGADKLDADGGALPQASSLEVDEPDPIRRSFKELMLTLGVEPATVDTWAAHYSEETIEGGGDSQKRLKLLEKQGVVGEVSLPRAMLGGLAPGLGIPGGAGGSREFMRAQMKAYNRWLSDFCKDAPGRRAGVLQCDLGDITQTIAEMKWGRENGVFGGIMLPLMQSASDLPGYVDPYYEQLWSACEDLGMVLNLHVDAPPEHEMQLYGNDQRVSVSLNTFELFWFSRRPVWFLILGGIFDRHPNLKLSVIENTVDWVPQCIEEMEAPYRGYGFMKGNFLERKPREYFGTNVFLGASLLERRSVEHRYEIGVDALMWGSDFPHPEGTTPYMRDSMRVQLGGIPEDEQRKMLGETIARVYPFDLAQLEKVAAVCGPTPEELSTPLSPTDVVEHASLMYYRGSSLSSY